MVLITLLYLYNLVISLFSFKKSRFKVPKTSKQQSFLVLIPCHNEEDVVEETVKNVLNSDYENFEVYVIADNCNDLTVEKASKLCKVIEVRGGSKPKALSGAVKWLKKNNKWNYDNIVVVDADNRISPTLLSSFNNYHWQGHKILQCRILSHNDKSFVAKGFTSSFNCMSSMFQQARNNVGLSASLSGTGFSIARNVWDNVDFNNCSSLTEDLEFSILAIMKGFKVKYIGDEYVLNQNLDELKPSIIQRLRWSRGYMQVSVRLSGKLFKGFIKRPSLQLFDSFIFINTPSKSVLYVVFYVAALLNKNFIPSWLVVVLFMYNLFFILWCNKFKLKYLIPHMISCFVTTFVLIWSFFTWRKTEWVKTMHKKID